MSRDGQTFELPRKSSLVEDLFTTQAMRDDAKLERIQIISVTELHPFQNHPFKIRRDAELEKLTESIRAVGPLTPALARPRPDGGYELISGHRRLAACQALGLETMPVVVKEMGDDEAVIAMVDANMQRETILPSEKAFAYQMKYEAIKHQGSSSQVGTKLRSDKQVGEMAGDSRNQVQRYIRLTNLVPEFLELVDSGKIAFNPAVELSYLSEQEQRALLSAMEVQASTPSHAQAIRLKKLSQEGKLDADQIVAIMAEEKPNQQEQYKFKREDIRKYFPKSYTDQQIYEAVFKALELLKRQRERNRDSR